MTHTISIGTTSKGKRVWLQALASHGVTSTRYTPHYLPTGELVLVCGPEGTRKITAAKGGIIDITSNKISKWAGDHTTASVSFTPSTITITLI